MGEKIRAQGGRKRATEAGREADRAEMEAGCSNGSLWRTGAAVADYRQCLNGAYTSTPCRPKRCSASLQPVQRYVPTT
jgi:hypothetical protein